MLRIVESRTFKVSLITKNYSEISQNRLIHGINLCNMKYGQSFSKVSAVRLKQRHRPSYNCMNLTTFVGFRNPLESPME